MNKYGGEHIVRDHSFLVGLRVRISTLNEHTFLSALERISVFSGHLRGLANYRDVCHPSPPHLYVHLRSTLGPSDDR
jgi:hypothetical protein